MTQTISPSFSQTTPGDDTHRRSVCDHCGFVDYQNPRIVVGSVVWHQGKYLLCRRAIEPRHGFWTVPAGYLEKGETPEEGARREAREEACADITIEGLLAVYTVRHLSQVQLIYRASLPDGAFAAGDETLEARLFAPEDLADIELAFPTVHWMLDHHSQWRNGASPIPFGNPQ